MTTNSSVLVLASASAARTRLLRDAGVDHVCDPAHVDESAIKNAWSGTAENLALELARAKALESARRHPGVLVIGADQVLALNNEILDKPGHVDKIRDQLSKLRGRTHTLISAVTVVRDGEVLWQNADQAHLAMRNFPMPF